MLADNPYAPPQETSRNQYPATARSHLNRLLLMLPFSFVSALAGGAMNRDPGMLLIHPGIHPLAPSGLVFGLCAALAGGLIFSTRRIWITPFIPFVAMAAFGITGHLMNLADMRLRNGGSGDVCGGTDPRQSYWNGIDRGDVCPGTDGRGKSKRSVVRQ